MTGVSVLGYSRTGSFLKAIAPMRTMTMAATKQTTGRLMEISERIMS